MKVKKVLSRENKSRKDKNGKSDMLRSFVVVSGCAVLSLSLVVSSHLNGAGEDGKVYAASESEESAAALSGSQTTEETLLPSGIAGMVSGVSESPTAGTKIKRIGTSCENVMVGQRVKVVESGATRLNISGSMENTVETLDQAASDMAENPTLMSDEDYDTLLRIVEAEAGSEDVKGRVLVANVIMNRVNNEEFPDTVTEVV